MLYQWVDKALIHLVLLAVIIVIIVAIYLAMYAPRGEGTLFSRITIGPISPLCIESISMQSSWYSNEVIIIPQSGNPIHVPVNWTMLNGSNIIDQLANILSKDESSIFLTSVNLPSIAAAAALIGLTGCVLAPGPCLLSKFPFEVLAHLWPSNSISEFIAIHMLHPEFLHSKHAIEIPDVLGRNTIVSSAMLIPMLYAILELRSFVPHKSRTSPTERPGMKINRM